MKIWDCFIFFDELELLELRLLELDRTVDHFVLVEATKDFQDKPKDLIYEQNKGMLDRWTDRITHVVVENLPPYRDRFNMEIAQRRAIMRGLSRAANSDLIIMSDVDEIPRPAVIAENARGLTEPMVLNQTLYYYWLNMRQKQRWNGTILTRLGYTTDMQWLRDRRNTMRRYGRDGGWHFSWVGGVQRIQKKLHAIGERPANLKTVSDAKHLRECLETGKDHLGRTKEKFEKEFVPIDPTFPSSIWEIIHKYPYLYRKGNEQI
jgi:beta-1,4-mannosyl-glycoprotein beta-1,4-N-acetylglucosaminyltransferase